MKVVLRQLQKDEARPEVSLYLVPLYAASTVS